MDEERTRTRRGSHTEDERPRRRRAEYEDDREVRRRRSDYDEESSPRRRRAADMEDEREVRRRRDPEEEREVRRRRSDEYGDNREARRRRDPEEEREMRRRRADEIGDEREVRRRRDPEEEREVRRRRSEDYDEDYEPRRKKNSGRNDRNRRKKKKSFLGLKIFLGFMIFMIVMGAAGVAGGLFFFQKKAGMSVFDCIKEGHAIAAASEAKDFQGGSISYIYASNGKKIGELSLNNDAVYLNYDQIPRHVVDAFVAIEDRTFWTNDGTDPKGMARVLFNFVKSRGKTANGASTITQQLVKLTYLNAEKTLTRKLKEMVIARDITKMYSKEEIAAFYCNACCFANGIYGIHDAAEAYFNKKPEELSISEMAYLCAIPNRPEYYNPKKNPENALTRRDKILRDMRDLGYITVQEYDKAIGEDIRIADVQEEREYYNYETTYAIHCATRYIMELSGFEFRYSFMTDSEYKDYQQRYDDAYAEAKQELYSGSYKVYTTIDTEVQKQLQTILDEELAEKDTKLDNGIYQVQGAMTVIDNENGKVVGVIGGRSQEETEGIYTLNRAYQGYAQPGSSIKPLVVYGPALDSGDYTPASELQNIDVTKAKEDNLTAAEISEMEGNKIPLRSAVEKSLNGCAYWLFSQIGVKNGISYIQNMNFSHIMPGDYNMSTCLGGLTYGVTTEEMANAYYTLENDGTFTDTDCIASMLNRSGEEIYETPESVDIYSVEASQKLTNVMMGVLTDGTARYSNWYDHTDTEAAGKTGTTNDNKAAWFCGYTPYYTISVWVGCDTPVAINGLTGGSYPLSIWQRAMLYMIDGKPTAYFPEVEEDEEEHEECICSTRCTVETRNEECPVCKYDVWECTGTEAVCNCTEKCFSDSLNESCPVCMVDMEQCKGKELTCSCESRCSGDSINEECELCKKDHTSCKGTEETTEEPTTEEATTQAPETTEPPTQPPAPPTEPEHPADPPEEDDYEEQNANERSEEEHHKPEMHAEVDE